MAALALKSVQTKIILALVGAGLLAASLIGGAAYYVALQSTLKDIEKLLLSRLEVREETLKRYETAVIADLELLATDNDTGRTIAQLSKAYEGAETEFGSGAVAKAYVDDNPHTYDQRYLLERADGVKKYSNAHALVHSGFVTFLQAREYYDIFLINPSGDIVYTVAKEADFGTNLADGPYASSGLGEAFAAASELEAGQYYYSDQAPYAPSANAPASFIATPIYASAGFGKPPAYAGVLAFQISIDRLQHAINAEPAGSVTQTFLVGSDNILRTNVDQFDGPEVGIAEFNPEVFVANAKTIYEEGEVLARGTGLGGNDVVAVLEKITFLGRDWYLVTQEDKALSLAEVRNLRNNMLIVAGVIFGVLLGLSYLLGRSIAQPMIDVNNAVSVMAGGNLKEGIPHTARPDEIGQISQRVDTFRKKLLAAEAEQERHQQENDAAQAERNAMLSDLEESVGGVVSAVSEGRFDARVNREFEDAAINNLGQGVNRICADVAEFLEAIEGSVSNLAKGDLTYRIDRSFAGRYGEVCTEFNDAMARLNELMGGIKTTGKDMTGSIQEISVGSKDLAGRAESQAASLEETAATMEEITSTINMNAENAKKANDLASETQQRATRGREVVTTAVSAMSEIEGSSKKITDIISVIDSIAFQTNLLALNAAVEAARAGDAGKGFAVVASEVRTLAQRSSAAASDINSLITVSSEKVEDGVRLVNATGEALTEIVDAITEFSTVMAEISAASAEQSTGVAEVSSSVSHMDTMTQQNAGLADSSASAASALTEKAEHLSSLIDVFRIDEAEPVSTPAQKTATDLVGKPEPSPMPAAAVRPPAPSAAEDTADKEWMDIAKRSEPQPAPASSQSFEAASGEDWSDF